jgi:ABC-2 type transport system ATP-binding protein
VIDARGLVKCYGPLRALDGLTLAVERGELVGLVGPNGSGKSTLIKTLATLVGPDEGTAAIAGFDVVGAPGRVRALVGYMPDVPGLYQEMRVREFLEFFADAFRLRGPRRRAAVEAALARAGLGDRADTFVEALSLGMKQRLFIAKTLLHAPRLLLLDEPATGLDPLARIELRRLLRALNGEGITMLVSSHILADLEDICSRVTFIAAGRLAEPPASAPGAPPAGLACEIEVLGDPARAAALLRERAGVRMLEAAGARLRVEVAGGPEAAAAVLRDLVAAGVAVVRFDPRGRLEERYRRTFGGGAG